MAHDWGTIEAHPLFMETGVADVLARYRAGLIYLATPYSRLARTLDGAFCPIRSDGLAFEANKWVAMFAANGVTAVSPIACAVGAMGADTGDALDPLDGVFWEKWWRPLHRASVAVVIPPLDGWRESDGVYGAALEALRIQMKPVHAIRRGDL